MLHTDDNSMITLTRLGYKDDGDDDDDGWFSIT